MLIRQAEEKDVMDIKDLYFNFLTKYPPKEEQDKNFYKIFLETGSNRESTLNFYKENGFEIDTKHSFLKKL